MHVGEHTQLDRAVIASDATADKNRLDTGTLGWTDIENKAKSGGSQYAVSVSGGVGQNEDGSLKPIASGLPTASLASVSDSDSSSTRSAISDGEVVIRDKDKQQQDIADLSRDTANAHQALDNNFDKDKIRDQLETQTQAVALGTQAMDAWRTSKLSDEKAKIRAEMDANGELKGLSDEQINAKIEQSEQYKKVAEQYGVGSEFWRNGTAITGLLAGVLGGNVTGGMAAGAAPYVAGLIKEVTKGNEPARIALHTLASAILVKAQGGNSAAGAAGGFIAAAASDKLASALFNKKVEQLTPEEKAVISNLVTALGAAGGSVAGGGSQGIGGGANAARVEVENNSLRVKQNQDRAKEMTQCQGDACSAVVEKYKKINAEQHESVVNCSGAQDCVDKANEVGQLQADYANRINELLEKAHADGGLNRADQDELSVLQVTTIQLEADRNAAIHNALMSGDSSEAKQLAINSLAQAVGTSAAGIAAGINKGGKYQPNQGAVGNMNEFLKQPGFGSDVKNTAQKSSLQYQGQSVYKATGDIGDYIKKGDQFYLDGQHKNHIEVFDKRGNFRAVLNLDGTINEAKTKAAEGRKFK